MGELDLGKEIWSGSMQKQKWGTWSGFVRDWGRWYFGMGFGLVQLRVSIEEDNGRREIGSWMLVPICFGEGGDMKTMFIKIN